jgi:hypothetical protein
MSEPREIAFEDVRVGDRVRVEQVRTGGTTVRYDGEVTSVDSQGATLGHDDLTDIYLFQLVDAGYTITLLSRPVPEAKCGDIRQDDKCGCRFARTDRTGDTAVHWIGISGACAAVRLTPVEDSISIARLIPVDPS